MSGALKSPATKPGGPRSGGVKADGLKSGGLKPGGLKSATAARSAGGSAKKPTSDGVQKSVATTPVATKGAGPSKPVRSAKAVAGKSGAGRPVDDKPAAAKARANPIAPNKILPGKTTPGKSAAGNVNSGKGTAGQRAGAKGAAGHNSGGKGAGGKGAGGKGTGGKGTGGNVTGVETRSDQVAAGAAKPDPVDVSRANPSKTSSGRATLPKGGSTAVAKLAAGGTEATTARKHFASPDEPKRVKGSPAVGKGAGVGAAGVGAGVTGSSTGKASRSSPGGGSAGGRPGGGGSAGVVPAGGVSAGGAVSSDASGRVKLKKKKKRRNLAPSEPVRLPPAPVTSNSKMQKNRAGFHAREIEHYRELLLQKRRELLGDVSSMEREALRDTGGSLSNLPVHMADIGTDNYEQEFTLGLVEKDRQLMREINVALAKIQDGSYGICEGTGNPIGKPRLEVQPWARHSIEYARQIEKRNYRY